MNNTWLQYAAVSNRFKQTYMQGFLDVSGNAIVRNGSLSVKNGNVLIPNGDISMNGNIICSGSIELGATAGSGYKMVINGNTRVKNSITIDNDASVMSSLGVGKVSNDLYPLDVSGETRLSSNLTVGGSATIGSVVAGSSKFTGSVGIGANPDPTYALYTNGQFRSTELATFDQTVAIGPNIDIGGGELQSSSLYIKAPITSTAANQVIMNVPNNLYTSTDDANHSQVNNLEIDTKNRVIKPYRKYEGTLVTDAVNGWDLGAPGAYSFDHVYGRSLEVSKNVGIGKSSDATYAIDVSGASRLSSNLTVGGAATLASLANVYGTSKFSGNVGFGKVADEAHVVDISGSMRVIGNTFVNTSVVIGQSEPSTAALHVTVPYDSAVANSVAFEVPNVVYKSTSSTNPSQTNYLEIDTKTRSIKPYAKEGDTVLNSAATGWDLGGPGANRFNTIYGRDLQISTNTIKIEDDSGNQISMGFNATTGSVNYTVTTISGEVFVIKGVQTQKISSGAGTIDPSMLEFTGLSFGDTFVSNDVYNLASAFTYNLGTTNYTGNGTEFSTTSAAQSLNSFVTGLNLSTLLARINSDDSVVIKVSATDGRTAPLEGIDVEGSLVSLSNKIISVHKQGTTIKWTLWNSDAYQSSAGNFLHYIELKNINMASGTYFVAKTAGTLTYNITDTHYMSSGDLTPVNGDLYLYIERGPGNNWTKIPVSLPQSGSIQTQHLADSAVTTSKLANNSVTGEKIADDSISGLKITDNSITSTKLADGNVTGAKISDGAITSAKLADGAISSAALIANGVITGAKLVAGSVTESILGDAAVVTAKIANLGVTTVKIEDSAVTAVKVLDGTLTAGKFATDSITSIKIVAGAVTNAKIADNSISTEKIMDGAITASKLAAGVVTGNLLDASSVTMDKIASGAIVTEKIAGLSVTSAKIAALAVTSAKLADGAVTDAKLATNSIISDKIAVSAVTATKIATGAVTEDKVADGAIIGTKIASGAITGNHFNTSAVTADKIASMAVTTAKLNDFAVTTIKIGNLAVGTEQINDLAITGAKIALGAITTALLDASSVTMDNIASGAISVSKIASGAVTTAKIASGAITVELLDASAVTVDKIATGAVTTAKLADASVTTSKLNTSSVTTSVIADGSITTAKLNASSVTTSVIADGSITTAKLAAGFTLPSGAGGGTSITSTSNVLALSYATAMASTPVGYTSIKLVQDEKMSTLVSTLPWSFSQGNVFGADNVSKISGDGNVAVVSIANGFSYGGYFAVFRKNSSGVFVYSSHYNGFFDEFNSFNGFRPIILDINYDGSKIISTNETNLAGRDDPNIRKYKTYLFGVATYANSAWTNLLIPTHGTYSLRGIQFSGDYSKIVICYTICNDWDWVTSTGIYGILIYDSTTYTLLKNINTTAISNITVVQDNTTTRITPFGVSDTGSRIIYGTPGFNNLFGKVTIYETTFNSTSSTYSAVASSPAPSYAPVGYLPIPMENLPSRFKLKLGNGIYVGQAWYLSVSNYAVLPAIPHCVFEADKPSDLYSEIGTNTYRLTENTFARDDNNKRLVKSYLDSSVIAMQESIDNTSYKAAWQLFLKTGTTTNEVVIWTPSTGSASGKFITTYNGGPTTSGTKFGLGTGTPIVFYLEPESLSDLNPTTIVGERTGTAASGENSRIGGSVVISSNGNTIAYTNGNLSTNLASNKIQIYNFVSNNNWSLQKTIINSEIQGSTKPSIANFGAALKMNKNGNMLTINAGIPGSYIAVYGLINGAWTFSGYYFSGNDTNYELISSLSLSNDGRYGLIATGKKFYVFDFAIIDMSAKLVSTDYLNSNQIDTKSITTNSITTKSITTDYLTTNAGVDSNTTTSYSLKNTGTFLNNGNIVIYNPTTPLNPTLTFLTTNSNGLSGLGPIIEFRNGTITNAWGNTNGIYDYRLKIGEVGGYQTLIFEGQTRHAESGTLENQLYLTIGRGGLGINAISSASGATVTLIPNATTGSYAGGLMTFNSTGNFEGTNGCIWTDCGGLGYSQYRQGVARINGFDTIITQCKGDYEIFTGTGAITALNNRVSSVLEKRRLHILSDSGDVSIGGTAVSGTKLSVSGNISATGTIGSIKGVVTKSVEPIPSIYSISATVTGTGTTDDMTKSITTRVFLSGDGNRMIASGRTAKKVYIYNKVSGVFNTTATEITRADTDFAKYIGLSKDGIVIAVSNGTTIWIYRWIGSAWILQTQTLSNSTYTSNFVVNMKLSADGSKILVVSYTSTADNMISIYDTTTGSKIVDIGNMQTLENMDIAWIYLAMGGGVGNAENQSGDQWSIYHQYPWMKYSVELSDDTNTVIISSSNGPVTGNQYGKVVIYDVNYSTNTASRVGSFAGTGMYDYFGKRVAINQDGSVIAFSAGAFNVYNYTGLPSYMARVYVYSRTLGTTSWTLGKMYRDIDAGVGLIGFGLELRLNNVGNILYICSLPSTYGGPTQDAISIGMYGNGAWGDLSSISFVPGSMSGSSIAVDNNGSFAATELRNPTPHGGRINVYTPSAPASLILKTGMISSDRMTIDANGDIGVGTTSVTGTKMTISGNITATGSITSSSDDRLKENEVLVANATATLLKLRPEIYDKKPNFTTTDTSTWQKETGLIAQDVWYGAPELRHLVKLGTAIDYKQEYEPIKYPEIIEGIDISGVEFRIVEVPCMDVSGVSMDVSGVSMDVSGVPMDVSGVPMDVSGVPMDVSGNKKTTTKTIIIDHRPQSKLVTKAILMPINPANIVDIPLATDIQNDPDYTALGWGDTPASVNYIGLIPYLIKSIQELKAEIVEQKAQIVALENK